MNGGVKMLQIPVKPQGKWIMNEEGLKVYDGLGILVYEEKDIETALKIGSILFDDFKNKGEGINTKLDSDELKQKMKQEWEHYNSHCTECEKKLPKRYYRYENMNLCGRCYNKKDTWINRIKVV
jgi:hypothetical protein